MYADCVVSELCKIIFVYLIKILIFLWAVYEKDLKQDIGFDWCPPSPHQKNPANYDLRITDVTVYNLYGYDMLILC